MARRETRTGTRTEHRITSSTTSYVQDRLAKVAVSFVGRGRIRIVYRGTVPQTDCEGMIVMPAVFQFPHLLEADDELMAWSHVNHEMGHEDTQRRIEDAIEAKAELNPNPTIYAAVPAYLRKWAIPPGSHAHKAPSLSMLWWSKGGSERVGAALASEWGLPNGRLAGRQAFMLNNAIEDPRMEAWVKLRWPGTVVHLDDGHERIMESIRINEAEIRAKGDTKCSFIAFSMAVLYFLQGWEWDWLGDEVLRHLDGVKPLLQEHLDTRDPHPIGFADTVNLMLGVLHRMYEDGLRPQVADEVVCPVCGSPEIKAQIRGGMLVVTCAKCGYTEEHDAKEHAADHEEMEGEDAESIEGEGSDDGKSEEEDGKSEEEDGKSEEEDGKGGGERGPPKPGGKDYCGAVVWLPKQRSFAIVLESTGDGMQVEKCKPSEALEALEDQYDPDIARFLLRNLKKVGEGDPGAARLIDIALKQSAMRRAGRGSS